MSLKALSIRQPWLHLILDRRKTIECRNWKAYEMVGKRFLLHAASTMHSEGLRYFYGEGAKPDFALGAYVAIATLEEIVEYDGPGAFFADAAKHLCKSPEVFEYSRYGFRLKNVRRLPRAITGPGRLNFFEVPEAIAAEAMAMLDGRPAAQSRLF